MKHRVPRPRRPRSWPLGVAPLPKAPSKLANGVIYSLRLTALPPLPHRRSQPPRAEAAERRFGTMLRVFDDGFDANQHQFGLC